MAAEGFCVGPGTGVGEVVTDRKESLLAVAVGVGGGSFKGWESGWVGVGCSSLGGRVFGT